MGKYSWKESNEGYEIFLALSFSLNHFWSWFGCCCCCCCWNWVGMKRWSHGIQFDTFKLNICTFPRKHFRFRGGLDYVLSTSALSKLDQWMPSIAAISLTNRRSSSSTKRRRRRRRRRRRWRWRTMNSFSNRWTAGKSERRHFHFHFPRLNWDEMNQFGCDILQEHDMENSNLSDPWFKLRPRRYFQLEIGVGSNGRSGVQMANFSLLHLLLLGSCFVGFFCAFFRISCSKLKRI